MDVHSSSLLSSNAPAPDQLAEEHSALSHVYSDVRSNTPESSPQPLPSPYGTSQDATEEPSVESTLIEQIVSDMKVMIKIRGEELDGLNSSTGLESRQLTTWKQNAQMMTKLIEENMNKIEESMVEYDLVRNLSGFTDADFSSVPQSFGTLVMPPRHVRNSWVERKQGVVCDPFGMLGGD